MNRYEIEIKLKISDKAAIEKGLCALGFASDRICIETDTYFNSDFYDFAKKGEALRIRNIKDLTQDLEHSEITYKGKKLDQVSMSRKELESSIGNPEVLEAIFEIIGLNQKYTVKKTRHYYQRDSITACVDEVEGLGSFLELEQISVNETERSAILEQFDLLLARLGYRLNDSITTSYLSLLQNKTD